MVEFPTDLMPGGGCKSTDRIAGPWSDSHAVGALAVLASNKCYVVPKKPSMIGQYLHIQRPS
jgi:hypothetical protein